VATIQLTPFTTTDRVLCVCQYGHSRSVALARLLHAQNIQAVAVGWQTAGCDFLEAIAWQSTKIITLQDGYFSIIANQIPWFPTKRFCSCFDVGPDRWVNPYNPELADLLSKMFASYQADPRHHITPADVGYVLS
jgi:hypothetical protein